MLIVKMPLMALPSPDALTVLARLTSDPNNIVYIVSGCDQAFLEVHLGLPASLDEHGGFICSPDSTVWMNFTVSLDMGRMEEVAEIFRYYTERTTGSHRDEEELDYRSTDPEWGGDNVNGLDPNDRTPDPERLLRFVLDYLIIIDTNILPHISAYFHSTATLNYVRGLLTSGFASSPVGLVPLTCPFASITVSSLMAWYSVVDQVNGIGNCSHEGLKLDWEQAMSREVDITGSGSSLKERGFYNTSAHFLWVGDRMRQLDGAHIEYFRGIRNPIGIKVGPSLQNEELIRLLQIVNPNKESGRVTLITRYGAGKIGDHLAGHIEAVKCSQHPVAWVCDPMHGNGFKIRNFGTVISELTSCIRIHAACGSRLGGVSLEFTGELNDEGFSVTECLGGSMELSEEQLGLRYHSFCDPQLNFEQSIDVAFLISNYFKEERLGDKGENGIYAALGGRKIIS
ncbi:DAHP synthetase [Suillus subalutaceus]|uniref:DAHP synthetase n=1 Tax=Suillus subalutaceus TaxID=48586 RepID=UPI001B8788DF|nr:DAHP synthetase [Suillus subalutaceus]KAG1838445.1 DAHP synthetase [Suillus subalutaceus]